MAACPACKARIPWWRLTEEFACRSCGAALTAQTGARSIVSIFLWVAADVPARRLVLDTVGDNGWGAVAMRLAASCLLGLAIAWAIIGRSRVALRDGG